jgi:ADP-ribose pyrophosphatase YjhB (NUDIX family)
MNEYVRKMRQLIGSETLLTVGCGAIIEEDTGRILLQRRTDGGVWGIPGGLIEIGETLEESVKREVYEETNLHLNHLQLFGLYSGQNAYAVYPNGDKVFSIQVIFFTKFFSGNLQKNRESLELTFFSRYQLPKNLNQHQAPFIIDWAEKKKIPILK